MARARDVDEDIVSISSTSQGHKRKRAPSTSSGSSSDRPVVKSRAQSSTTVHTSSKAIKQGNNKARPSSATLKPDALSKGKSTKSSSSDSDDDESEEEIVVAYSKARPVPMTTSIARTASPDESDTKVQPRKPLVPPRRRTPTFQDQDNQETISRTTSLKALESKRISRSDILDSNTRHRGRHDSPAVDAVGRSSNKSGSQSSSKTLDDWLSPSPKISSTTSSRMPSASQHQPKGDDGKQIKSLLRQIAGLREKQQEAEDRFDEASTTAESLQARVKELEREAAFRMREHGEDIARLKAQLAGGGNIKQRYQAEIEQLENQEIRLRADHDHLVLLLYAQIEQLKGQIATQSVTQRQDADAALTARAHELEQKITKLEEDRDKVVDDLKREVELSKRDLRLAAKDREIESIHVRYGRHIETLEQKYATLNTRYELDKQAKVHQGYESLSSGVPPSEDVYHLQNQLAHAAREKKRDEEVFRALIQTYEARQRKMKQQDTEREDKYLKTVRELESARQSLAFDVDRFSGQAQSMTKKRDELQKDLSDLEGLRPKYERLKKEVPGLQEELSELGKLRDTLMQENASMRKERLLYVDQLSKTREDLQELEARFEMGASRSESHEHLAEQHELLKNTYRLERQNNKLKKHKLRRRLKLLENTLRNEGIELPADEDSSSDPRGERIPRREKESDMGRSRSRLRSDSVQSILASAERHVPQILPLFNEGNLQLKERIGALLDTKRKNLLRYEEAKPSYQFPPCLRERKANTRVPWHKTRLYVRSEDHTPYAPNESVSDSDDEFLEWESQAYAKSQSKNPDRLAALVNTCWNRHILDIRGNRVRSTNLHFCIEFVESYGPLLHSREASQALLKHMLRLVDLGQLTPDEGGTIVRAFNQAL